MSGGRTRAGMARRILEGNFEIGAGVVAVLLIVEMEAVLLLFAVDEPGPDVERNLGAMLTSVLVVNRRTLPFDCGSRETGRVDCNQVPSAIQFQGSRMSNDIAYRLSTAPSFFRVSKRQSPDQFWPRVPGKEAYSPRVSREFPVRT